MYITNYNLNRFLSRVTADVSDVENLLELLSPDFAQCHLENFFSTYELKRLAGAKRIFEDTVGITTSGLERLDIRPIDPNHNNPYYLLPSNTAPPAYHKDHTCEKLNSDYHTISIPKAIIDLSRGSPELIDLYRSIYENPCGTAFLLGDEHIDWQALANTFRAESLSKLGIAVSESILPNPREVTLKNSKPTTLPNSPKQEMSECLDLLEAFIQETLQNKTYKDIYNWRYLPSFKRKEFARIRGEDYIKINAHLNELQKSLYQAIISYLKLKIGFDQDNVDEQLLIACGFINCRTCNR